MINIIAKFFCGLQINQEGNQTTNYSWLYSPAEATFKSKLEFDTLSVSIWKNSQQAQSMGQDEILKILMQSKHGVQNIIPSTSYRPCSKLYLHVTFCQFRRNVCSFSRFTTMSQSLILCIQPIFMHAVARVFCKWTSNELHKLYLA